MANDHRSANRLPRFLAWLSIALLATLLAAPAALAHKPSDSYLTLRVAEAEIAGQWDIALRDLDYAIGLDDNQDGAITWGELRAHQPDIAAYALARLDLAADGQGPARRASSDTRSTSTATALIRCCASRRHARPRRTR